MLLQGLYLTLTMTGETAYGLVYGAAPVIRRHLVAANPTAGTFTHRFQQRHPQVFPNFAVHLELLSRLQ